MPLGLGWGTASPLYSLKEHSTCPIIGGSQEVHNIIRISRCVFHPSGAQTGSFEVEICCADHWSTEILQLWPPHNIINVYFVNNTLLHAFATHSLAHNTLAALQKTKLHILRLPPLLFYQGFTVSKLISFASWECVYV